MKVFYCTDHEGMYPVGTASIVRAPDEAAARGLLADQLRSRGLSAVWFTLEELGDEPQAIILRDGDY